MGWSGGDGIAEDSITRLGRMGLTDEQRAEILETVIGGLRNADWDTYDDVLADHADEGWVVEAFRRNGIEYEPGRWSDPETADELTAAPMNDRAEERS